MGMNQRKVGLSRESKEKRANKDSMQTENFNWQLDVQVFARGLNISDVHLYVKVTHCRFKFGVLVLSRKIVN